VNTTEIFVEQVLIGVLVLLIAALPFVSAIPPDLPDAFKIIGTAIGVVGVAYLLGIPFDRFADSLTSSLEKRIRLKLCLKRPLPGSEDPFPEDLLKIAVLQAESGTVAWAEYLRSRMRLTRAVAVFAPGLTLSAMLASVVGTRLGGDRDARDDVCHLRDCLLERPSRGEGFAPDQFALGQGP
jgi:hypothetical protein